MAKLYLFNSIELALKHGVDPEEPKKIGKMILDADEKLKAINETDELLADAALRLMDLYEEKLK